MKTVVVFVNPLSWEHPSWTGASSFGGSSRPVQVGGTSSCCPSPRPVSEPGWHWLNSAWGRQQPYVGKWSCVRSSAAPGASLPGPVTDDFPCLTGRQDGGWGSGGLGADPMSRAFTALNTRDCHSWSIPRAEPQFEASRISLSKPCGGHPF